MKKILFISISLIILILGCKKDKESNTIQDRTTLSQFLTKYTATSQYFTVTAGQGTEIIGEKGTVVRIQPYSFYPIMSGDIKIELKEYYSRKDILLNNLQTVTNNNLLATAGMIYLDVSQNGTGINNWSVITKMPAQIVNPNMQIFFSNTQPEDSSIYWSVPDTSSIYLDSNNTYNSLINSSNRFLWINCDYFVNQLPITTVTASFTNAPQSSYAPRVYIVLDINAIANMWLSYPNYGWYTIDNIPVGLTGKIVAFNVVNGVYYFCKQPITVTTNLNQPMTFQTVTEQQLITELENL